MTPQRSYVDFTDCKCELSGGGTGHCWGFSCHARPKIINRDWIVSHAQTEMPCCSRPLFVRSSPEDVVTITYGIEYHTEKRWRQKLDANRIGG